MDYENVHEADLDRLGGKAAHVTLVLGERHKALPVPLVKLIQSHAAQVSLVETGLAAKNALDFVLACEVGRQTEIDPTGYYHILSRDKGFDAVVRYLKDREILASRRESFAEIPALMKQDERAEFLQRLYREKKVSRPAKRKTLESSIQAAFAKSLTPDELEKTIQGLVKDKVIEITETGSVTYPEECGQP
ncbi:MAG: PIN domain-containing protein [Opitutaceae bacterium]